MLWSMPILVETNPTLAQTAILLLALLGRRDLDQKVKGRQLSLFLPPRMSPSTAYLQTCNELTTCGGMQNPWVPLCCKEGHPDCGQRTWAKCAPECPGDCHNSCECCPDGKDGDYKYSVECGGKYCNCAVGHFTNDCGYPCNSPCPSPSLSPSPGPSPPGPSPPGSSPSPSHSPPGSSPSPSPSQSPTTSSPSQSPTTSSPSQSPTTSSPSQSPSPSPCPGPDPSPSPCPSPPCPSPSPRPCPSQSQGPSPPSPSQSPYAPEKGGKSGLSLAFSISSIVLSILILLYLASFFI